MSTFNPSDLFLLQRPFDTADPYKAVSRDSMKALGIVTGDIPPTNDEQGQLWFRPALGQLYIYDNGDWVEASVSPKVFPLKVSRSGDSMTGQLTMVGDASVNFPIHGGITLGNTDGAGGHMVLVSYDNNADPSGYLTAPTAVGGLDSIAKWTNDGLHVLKDPVDPAHATHKEYVDTENHLQNVVIQRNSTNIITLFDDLESVRPSVLRAKYDYMKPVFTGDPTPPGRTYFTDGTNVLYAYTDDITEIYLNKEAKNGITYDFSRVTQDYLVEVQDVKGIGIILAEVVTISETANQIKIDVNVVKYRDSGVLDGELNPTEVRILVFRSDAEIDISAEDRFAKIFEPNTFQKNNTFNALVHVDSLAPLPGATGYIQQNIFSVVNGATGVTPGKDRFNINSAGQVTAGPVFDPFMAQYDNDVATKKYVDERMKRVGAYYGDTPPSNPDPGMLWYDTKADDLTMYMYYENPDNSFVWVPVYSPTKGGGVNAPPPFSTVTDRNGIVYNTQDELNTFLVSDSLYKDQYDSYLIDEGELLDTDTNVLEIKGRVNQSSSLAYDSLLSVKRRDKSSTESDYVSYNGSVDEPNSITTKEYVDLTSTAISERLEEIRDDLDAISLAVEKGKWTTDHNSTTGRSPNPGFFALYSKTPDLNFITDFTDTNEVWISESDIENTTHDFVEDLTVDKYLTVRAGSGFLIAFITDLEESVYRSNKYFKLAVTPVQANGSIQDNVECTIKVFDPPSGRGADEFLPLAGGTMTGHLQVTNPSAASGTYLFSVEAPNLESGKQVAFRVTGNGRVKAGHDTNNAFVAVDTNDVLTKQYADEKLIYNQGTQTLNPAKWKLQQLDSNNTNRIFVEIEDQNMKLYNVQDPTNGETGWAATKGYVDTQIASISSIDPTLYLEKAGDTMTGQLILDRVGDTTNGFIVKGKDGSGNDIDLLRVYHNSGSGDADAINYTGKQSADTNIVTVKHVKDNYLGIKGTQDLNTDTWVVKQKNQSNNNRTFISIHDGEMNLYNVADPTDGADGWATNRGYVDDQVDKKVNLTGDSMTGRIDITMPDPANAAIRAIGSINVKADNQEIGGGNNFIAHKDYVRVFSTPSGPQDVVNKSYLEEQIDAINAPDLDDYFTKDSVRDLVYRPARLQWILQGVNGGSSKPEDQKFKFDGDFIRCSFLTANDIDLSAGLIGDTGSISFTDGPVGVIWYRDSLKKWKMKQQFRVNSWRWNYNGHFEFKRSSRHGTSDSSLTLGAFYYLTVGGFF